MPSYHLQGINVILCHKTTQLIAPRKASTELEVPFTNWNVTPVEIRNGSQSKEMTVAK